MSNPFTNHRTQDQQFLMADKLVLQLVGVLVLIVSHNMLGNELLGGVLHPWVLCFL